MDVIAVIFTLLSRCVLLGCLCIGAYQLGRAYNIIVNSPLGKLFCDEMTNWLLSSKKKEKSCIGGKGIEFRNKVIEEQWMMLDEKYISSCKSHIIIDECDLKTSCIIMPEVIERLSEYDLRLCKDHCYTDRYCLFIHNNDEDYTYW